ncbi:MAG TPA: aminopeptidase [Solirubrobacteraceae bacterium]|jgi:aminopeptidase|nr:aminopeptidase [Solirubrobacteraceae bacterium]
MTEAERFTSDMATLAVRLGANVQPGQIVALSSEPGKEAMARAVAEAAYSAGAKFVDLNVFDVYFKRARALNAERDTLGYVPPWLGERVLALGEHRAARISLSGPVAPHALDDVDPGLISLDRLPRVPEAMKVLNDASTNWTIVPCPTPAWASLVFPRLEPPAALERLWSEIAHVTRLDEPDPIQAWEARMRELKRVSAALDELKLDRVHFEGPGTDLSIGLLPASIWLAAKFQTAGGIEHQPNIPTEEVFTTPDPERVDGEVTSTKPLFTSGTTVTGLKIRFEGGRAVQVDAEQGAEVVQGMIAADDGAARLGEVALVDRDGRIGPLGTVFYDTLLDENAASHIALGHGYVAGVSDPAEHERVNKSVIHTDFMIGSTEVAVTGFLANGDPVPLLRDGRWQI